MKETLHSPRVGPALAVFEPAMFEDDSIVEEALISGTLVGATTDCMQILGSRLCDLRITGTHLTKAIFRDCAFERCELSGTVLEEASFHRVEFVDCRLSGAVFAGSRMKHVRFTDCRLDKASFRMLQASLVQFSGCHMEDADFYGAKIISGQLLKCDLTSADFSQAKISGTEMHGSILEKVRGGTALRGLVIDGAQMLAVATAVFSSLDISVTDEPTQR